MKVRNIYGPHRKKVLKVYLINEGNIRNLYQTRLTVYAELVSTNNNVEEQWSTIWYMKCLKRKRINTQERGLKNMEQRDRANDTRETISLPQIPPDLQCRFGYL